MNAAQIAKEKEKLSEVRARCLEENLSLIEQGCSEVRTVSYLALLQTIDQFLTNLLTKRDPICFTICRRGSPKP
jgi:hypothetical protein